MEISIRELKANPSRAIAQARSGERVTITSHRKVVAELVMPRPEAPPRSADDLAMARLLASGLVSQAATKPFLLGKAITLSPAPDGQSMSDLVIELRGPR